MNDYGKSDNSIVPGKFPNKAPKGVAEEMEERGLGKGNLHKQNVSRAQGRTNAPSAFERVRQAARSDKKQRFTALYHHVYCLARLRAAYYAVKRNAAPGIDGETWRHYGENLEENLQDLSNRLKRGAYRAKPVRRTYIPKADGRSRPIGLPILEDKIVQRAVVEVLNAIYEQDFLNFSYGFRPGRNQHQALDALSAGIMQRKVNWVLDADIQAFFDTLSHEWLVKFVEYRIADKRIVRLIQKWLRAGVFEEGRRVMGEIGTVQGGSISPLLSNIYLHYVFDLWVQWWRRNAARGDVIVTRFADDFVLGFQYRSEAKKFLAELQARFVRFGLRLHPEKSRLIEFGRFAAQDRERRTEGKPETFNFLGFTHICGKTKRGMFTVLRKTMRKKWQAKLRELYVELRRRMHEPVPEQGAYLRAVVLGHMRYYGVPMNSRSLQAFRWKVGWLWWKVLRSRSQKNKLTWIRMGRLIAKWLPPARIYHPYPLVRFGVIT
ncbi:MAG: group II intron reverse transcriptase/maturase [Deltaproteobacteria bacterium]